MRSGDGHLSFLAARRSQLCGDMIRSTQHMLDIAWIFRVVIVSAVFMLLFWFIKQSFIKHRLVANTLVFIDWWHSENFSKNLT